MVVVVVVLLLGVMVVDAVRLMVVQAEGVVLVLDPGHARLESRAS